MIKHVIWASMIDYPGHTSAVLFTEKCNFNCSYCYNRKLSDQPDKIFEQEILPKLIERKDFVNHVVISGGEPTIDESFEEMLTKLHNEGFVVGIHTNASNPNKIIDNINKISFLGIDIKSVKSKYNEIAGTKVNLDNVEKLLRYVIENGIAHEVRTTLFPKHVSKEDILEIAKWLKEAGEKKYHLQQFYAVNGAEEVESYTEEELQEICNKSNEIITTVLKSK